MLESQPSEPATGAVGLTAGAQSRRQILRPVGWWWWPVVVLRGPVPRLTPTAGGYPAVLLRGFEVVSLSALMLHGCMPHRSSSGHHACCLPPVCCGACEGCASPQLRGWRKNTTVQVLPGVCLCILVRGGVGWVKPHEFCGCRRVANFGEGYNRLLKRRAGGRLAWGTC
jgi:hypothetical protein